MPAETTSKVDASERRIKELEAENQKLLEEVHTLKEELATPVEAEWPDEYKVLVRDLAATYVRIKTDGHIDSRERDELDAKLGELLAKLNTLLGV